MWIDHLPAAKSPQTKIRELVDILNKDITYAGGKLSISKEAQQALQELGKLQASIKSLYIEIQEGQDPKLDIDGISSKAKKDIQQFVSFKNQDTIRVIIQKNGYAINVAARIDFFQ